MNHVIHRNGRFWVRRATFGRSARPNGYEVYQDMTGYATRQASIGYDGDKGLQMAIERCDELANRCALTAPDKRQ